MLTKGRRESERVSDSCPLPVVVLQIYLRGEHDLLLGHAVSCSLAKAAESQSENEVQVKLSYYSRLAIRTNQREAANEGCRWVQRYSAEVIAGLWVAPAFNRLAPVWGGMTKRTFTERSP